MAPCLLQSSCCACRKCQGPLRLLPADKNASPAHCLPPAAVKGLCLLTMKPMIYAANVTEEDLASQGDNNKHVQALRKKAAEEDCDVVVVSAQVSPT
jgi:hypothetical protein